MATFYTSSESKNNLPYTDERNDAVPGLKQLAARRCLLCGARIPSAPASNASLSTIAGDPIRPAGRNSLIPHFEKPFSFQGSTSPRSRAPELVFHTISSFTADSRHSAKSRRKACSERSQRTPRSQTTEAAHDEADHPTFSPARKSDVMAPDGRDYVVVVSRE